MKKIKLPNEFVNEAEFKNINRAEHAIKLAIKDAEKKSRLKVNRDKPPVYDPKSLNKIMLSKVLGRGRLDREHEDAWERLKKEYDLKESVNEASSPMSSILQSFEKAMTNKKAYAKLTSEMSAAPANEKQMIMQMANKNIPEAGANIQGMIDSFNDGSLTADILGMSGGEAKAISQFKKALKVVDFAIKTIKQHVNESVTEAIEKHDESSKVLKNQKIKEVYYEMGAYYIELSNGKYIRFDVGGMQPTVGKFKDLDLSESVTEAQIQDLSFKSLLGLGAKATVKLGEDKLLQLSDALDYIGSEQADAVASHLNMAIELIQEREPKEAQPHIKKFQKACKKALKQLDESLEEKEGVKHYTKDGKEWTGATHKMPNGKLMTQNPHNEDSEELFHKEDLSESVVNEAKGWNAVAKVMDAALKKANVSLSYAKEYVQSLERMAKRDSKQFFADYGDMTEDDFIEDVEYNMRNESVSVNEADFPDVSNKFKKALDSLPDEEFTTKNIEKLIQKTKEKRPDAAMAYAKAAFGWLMNEAKFDKKKLMKAMKKDDGMITVDKGIQYIVYKYDNGNDHNDDMWQDDVIFALDQDGEEHEIKYSDIESYSESVVTESFASFTNSLNEKWNFSEAEVKAAAEELAKAMANTDKVKVEVHDLEYDKGRGAGFELSWDGDKHDGGSYYIKDNGDVINAAIGGVKFGTITSTQRDFEKGIRATSKARNESRVTEATEVRYKKGDKIEYQLTHKGGVGKYADAMSKSKNTESGVIKKRIKGFGGTYKYLLTSGLELYASEIIGLWVRRDESALTERKIQTKKFREFSESLNERVSDNVHIQNIKDALEGLENWDDSRLDPIEIFIENLPLEYDVTEDQINTILDNAMGMRYENLIDFAANAIYKDIKTAAKGLSKYYKPIKEGVTKGRRIQTKRKYTENHPAKTVGKNARIRNKILEVLKDGKMNQASFDKLVKELSSDNKRWMKRNGKMFNVSEDGISLSRFGRRILKGIVVNESFSSFTDSLNESLSKSDVAYQLSIDYSGNSKPKVVKLTKKVLKVWYGFKVDPDATLDSIKKLDSSINIEHDGWEESHGQGGVHTFNLT